MNGVQTRLKCKPNVKRCKRFVFAAHSPLLHPNTLKTKAIIHFQTDHILTRFVFPPLYAVFIDPPLAHIGITEEEALRKGYSFKVSRLPATSIVRSRTLQQTDGMLKAIINSHSGKIMGCTLFCTDAPELINMVAMAMKTGQTSTFLRDFIFTHPSMSEGLNQLFDV